MSLRSGTISAPPLRPELERRAHGVFKENAVLHICISVLLCITTIVGTLTDHDVTAIAALTGTSFVTDGAWGGFYYWKSKNENRAKYAQRFLNKFADKYGADAALRAAEIVLKD